MWETWVRSLGWEDPLEEGMVTHCSIVAWRIPKDRGAWLATVHGVTKSQARVTNKAQHRAVSNRYIHGSRSQTEVRLTSLVIIARNLLGDCDFCPCNSGICRFTDVIAQKRNVFTKEHSKSTLNFIYDYCWRRQWHPTPVLLPGKSHGRRSLVGCSPWGG